TVAKAEGSVLIAREVEITGSAVNCFVIADTIRIKKAGGTSFYAQNVAIEELDMTDGSYNPVTGFIALRDNLKARKAIRRFEKRRRRLEKVEQMESFIREQGLSEAWAALDARMSTKEPLTPEETHQFGPLLQPYEYVRRRKNMVVKDRDFFADSGNVAEYEAALKAIETHEENMRGAVKLSLGSLAYPPELIKSISETAATNLSAAMRLAPHTISAYVSSDPSIAELSKAEDKWKRHFIGHFSKMLAGNVVNEARIRRLKSLALLKSNCDLGYETLKELAVSDDEDEVMEERRNDSARIEIGNELVIPVMIDNYSMGRMRNVSDHGISVFFDDTQDNPPVFEKLEEVQVSFKIGDIEHRYPFAVTVVIENDSAGLVKIGGFYAHANEDVLNKTRRLRTEIETALAKKRRGGG
ncbi:MAG: hypothetical protein QG650_583, partial [Patescibacteria group bacterium]|nr:hypothetical protein [Patescibacteria group bacterium]